MKNFIAGLMIALMSVTSIYAGECSTGSCSVVRLPRRIVTLSKEVVQVPVEVTTRSVTRIRKLGRRVCVNDCGCQNVQTVTQEPTLAK